MYKKEKQKRKREINTEEKIVKDMKETNVVKCSPFIAYSVSDGIDQDRPIPGSVSYSTYTHCYLLDTRVAF